LLSSGLTGASGATGATGATGIQGVPGNDGSDGSDGNDGLIGATGASGASGATGSTGPQGNDGVDGADGADSVVPGATGATGATGPAYLQNNTSYVYAGATGTQALPTSTSTKVVMATEISDINSAWDTVNSRYQPQVTGNYLITSSVFFFGPAAAILGFLYLYKNGVPIGRLDEKYIVAAGSVSLLGSQIVPLNGSTDYLEIWASVSSAATIGQAATTPPAIWMTAMLLPGSTIGPTGATGIQGVPGNDGLDGSDGNDGPIGATGATGLTGATGATGLIGATGQAGESGVDGADGADSMVAGATGATGQTGATGATGGTTGIGSNSQSAPYTTVLADANSMILHPAADTTARTWTVDSNANVPYPVATALTFVNQHGAGVLTLAITADTMRLAGAGTTGNRTLAADGIATALKITATEWLISGVGLT
jgi:hypothetical protein